VPVKGLVNAVRDEDWGMVPEIVDGQTGRCGRLIDPVIGDGAYQQGEPWCT